MGKHEQLDNRHMNQQEMPGSSSSGTGTVAGMTPADFMGLVTYGYHSNRVTDRVGI